MITEYHRPQTLEEALDLLTRPNTRPLGGGTLLSRPSPESFAVVDLQALGLGKIRKSGEKLEIGATVTLQALLESPHTPDALKQALELESPLNLRNSGTVAGTLVACDGRSPLATSMLALDARLTVNGGTAAGLGLGDLLPLRAELLHGRLITRIDIPLNARLAFESVARTPADKPIVCAALAQWPSGRTRLALGGWGRSPALAMDGNSADPIQVAARNTAQEAGDEWASAEYRRDVAEKLAMRCMAKLKPQG